MKEEKESLCLSVDGLSKTLNIGLTNAYRLVKQKSFWPSRKIMGRYIISREDLAIWLKEQQNKIKN